MRFGAVVNIENLKGVRIGEASENNNNYSLGFIKV
jgi:hypothetical protein